MEFKFIELNMFKNGNWLVMKIQCNVSLHPFLISKEHNFICPWIKLGFVRIGIGHITHASKCFYHVQVWFFTIKHFMKRPNIQNFGRYSIYQEHCVQNCIWPIYLWNVELEHQGSEDVTIHNTYFNTVGRKILLSMVVCGKVSCSCMFPLYNHGLLAVVKNTVACNIPL